MFTKFFSLLIFSSFLLSIECQVSIYGQCGQCKKNFLLKKKLFQIIYSTCIFFNKN